MSHFNVYLKPFNDAGEYTDWIDISEDVDFDSVGDIRQVIDDDVYDVGIFKYSDFKLSMRNEHGRFSDVGGVKTIFRFKRSDSLVRITWSQQDDEPYCGVAICGETIAGNDEITVFEGLLKDDATETDIREQTADFRVLGKESIFSQVEVPFSSLANGDLVSEIIKDLLNQTEITSLLTYSASNILPATDVAVDDVTDYENRTVKEVLDELLFISNSVLYIKNDTIYVKSRDAGATIVNTFYGQAANEGVENIVSITNMRSGLNQTFNLWTWGETDLSARDGDSIGVYGVRKKEINHSAITNNTTRQSLLNALRTEFRNPHLNFTLKTTLTEDKLSINPLDRVAVSYPTVLYTIDETPIPIYGIARYGEAQYPFGEWSLELDNEEFKIMGRVIKFKDQLIEYKLKRIAE